MVVFLAYSLQRLYCAHLEWRLGNIVPYLLQGSKNHIKIEVLLEGFPTAVPDVEEVSALQAHGCF